MSAYRRYSLLDTLVLQGDNLLKHLGGKENEQPRETPAKAVTDGPLTEQDKDHAAGLMRVNHAGEVCAQALYLGQAVTARDETTKATLLEAAREEADHLYWCRTRLTELDSHTSFASPLWFVGSFAIGATAGLFGKQWNLGFVAETERQVEKHLEGHLDKLPAEDNRSRAIVKQMQVEEVGHADMAIERGGAELPWIVKKVMGLTSKVMTGVAYYV